MADEQVADQEQEQLSPELDAQAREMGWRPKEEFKGSEDKWVDAKTFVDRGEHVLPIVKATADRLRKDLATERERTAGLEAAVKAGQESIAALEKYHQDDVKQKVNKARADLKEQLKAAKKAGDVDAEVELTDELGKLNAADDAATTRDDTTVTTTRRAAPKDYTKEPEYIEWLADNQWFKDDPIKAAIAHQVSYNLRQANDSVTGRAFLDKVTEGTNKELARLGGSRPTGKRVESGKGGAGGANGGNGSGKSYADLPTDAKKACDSFGKDLVGPNRRYKDAAEWRASYVKQYFTEV
jgi:hypothetical protein